MALPSLHDLILVWCHSVLAVVVLCVFWRIHSRVKPYHYEFQNLIEHMLFASDVLVVSMGTLYTILTVALLPKHPESLCPETSASPNPPSAPPNTPQHTPPHPNTPTPPTPSAPHQVLAVTPATRFFLEVLMVTTLLGALVGVACMLVYGARSGSLAKTQEAADAERKAQEAQLGSAGGGSGWLGEAIGRTRSFGYLLREGIGGEAIGSGGAHGGSGLLRLVDKSERAAADEGCEVDSGGTPGTGTGAATGAKRTGKPAVTICEAVEATMEGVGVGAETTPTPTDASAPPSGDWLAATAAAARDGVSSAMLAAHHAVFGEPPPAVVGANGEVHDVALSKYLSKLLRHEALSSLVPIDRYGWAAVADALRYVNDVHACSPVYAEEDVRTMVGLNDKQRFELRERRGTLQIRATGKHTMRLPGLFSFRHTNSGGRGTGGNLLGVIKSVKSGRWSVVLTVGSAKGRASAASDEGHRCSEAAQRRSRLNPLASADGAGASTEGAVGGAAEGSDTDEEGSNGCGDSRLHSAASSASGSQQRFGSAAANACGSERASGPKPYQRHLLMRSEKSVCADASEAAGSMWVASSKARVSLLAGRPSVSGRPSVAARPLEAGRLSVAAVGRPSAARIDPHEGSRAGSSAGSRAPAGGSRVGSVSSGSMEASSGRHLEGRLSMGGPRLSHAPRPSATPRFVSHPSVQLGEINVAGAAFAGDAGGAAAAPKPSSSQPSSKSLSAKRVSLRPGKLTHNTEWREAAASVSAPPDVFSGRGLSLSGSSARRGVSFSQSACDARCDADGQAMRGVLSHHI